MDQPHPKEPIAIVGIGCRFPGNVRSAADLHALLTERRSAIVDVPADRWDAAALFHPDFTKPAHIHARRGGFLSGIDQFDAAFFGIAPNEAKRMDPQQRLVLETAWEALEDAGARLEDLAGKAIAVVMGCSGCDYDSILGAPTERANINGTTNTGLASSIVSNRVSYLFDLRGPSFTVDTACSSSLTALHHACRAIWEGAAEGALAGGVNLMLKPSTTIGFSKGAYLSPDAECRAFSDHANGYVRAEGAGVVFLKPLSKARADGDRIHALIRGTWINQDGKTPGMTMPSAPAQEALLRGAYADAGVDPADVVYVEAHGTGTPAGDPIEANAIGKVVGQARRGDAPLPMGSVKTNVGHLESAAGMAGLIKLVLTLKHRTVFPNLHFRAPNPKIALDALKLTVPTAPMALPAQGPLYGGVNSFGFGGANAHAVLESPPPELPRRAPSDGVRPHALFLSARSAAALKTLAGTVQPDPATCGAFSRQKSRFEFRLAVVGETAEDLSAGLKAFVDGKESPVVFTRRAAEGSKEKVAFVFSGQGGQHWQMGRQLFAHEPLFRQTVEQIAGLLTKLGWGDLIAELHRDEAASRMGQTQIAQPALFALEVGVAKLLMAHGVTPVAMVGHSIGELAAAHLSGALSLEEATRIVYWRSRCQAQAENKGAMAAIGLPEAEVEKLLKPYGGKIEVAAINGPAAITVAGTTPEVEALIASLEAKSVFAQRLNVSVPFHCALMDPIEAGFRRALGAAATSPTTTPYYSTVTGTRLDGAGLTLDYWFQNIRAPVRYLPAFQQLLADGVTCFVEIGPTAALRTGSTDAIAKAGARATYLGTLRQKGDERQLLMKTVAQLFTVGAPVSAEPLSLPHAFLPLPPHPFERQSHWLETPAGRKNRFAPAPHPHVERLETRVKSRDLFAATVALDARVDRYLADHKVQGLLVFPGAGQLELLQAAAMKALGAADVFLEGVEFRLPMVLDDGDAATRFALEVYSDEGHFQIASERDGQFTEHTRGRIQHGADRFVPKAIDLGPIRARMKRAIPLDALFRESAAAGLELGPAFRGIREFWASPTETLARIEAPAPLAQELGRHLIHPAVVDSVIQTAALGSLCRAFEAGDQSGLFLPYQVGRFQIHRPGFTGPLWCYATGEDVFAVDEAGQPVITIEGLVVRRVQGSVRASAAVHPNNHYQWEWKPLAPPALAGPRPEGTWVVVGDVDVRTPGPMRKAASVDQVPAGERVAGLVHALPSAASACQWANALSTRFVPGAEVWLVTHGVYDPQPSLAGAEVWGFGRVLMSEQPGLQTTLVDLGPATPLGELWRPAATEVRKDAAGFHAQSLIRAPAPAPRTVRIDAARTPYRAVVPTPGVLQSIVLEQQPPRTLGPDDVEVSVRATCLNFKDVVVAMGMLPPTAWEHGLSSADLGTDCAGVVSAVGANVRTLKVGDEVVGCAPKCLGNRAVAHRHLWVPKPKGLSWQEAAAIPTVYFTAVIGLERLARLSPGETVLIHAGAGGVGIAAIHVAKKLGARVFATTSSPEKRAFLTSLGVEKIFHSRSADFRQDVLEATGGRGVDVVLNSRDGARAARAVRRVRRAVPHGPVAFGDRRDGGPHREARSERALTRDRWVHVRLASARGSSAIGSAW